VNAFQTTRFWVILGAIAVGLIILEQFWKWEVERIEVLPGKVVVKIQRWGKDLPEDEIVAPDESYKGVMVEPLSEGRWFLNPIFWAHEVHDIVKVPPGECLVLTRKFGKPIPSDRLAEGDILAREGERGILAETLPPANYRLNPHAYDWQLVKAVDVGVNQVGVRILKMGKDPRTLPPDRKRSPYVVPRGYRGVQEEVEQKGTYYLNPYVETIVPVETREHRAEFSDIEFPSRDGFSLKPNILVVYRVQPEKAPELLVRLSAEGVLHQEDATPAQITQNEILQVVVLPHVRGYARIEGSNFEARDFVVTAQADGNFNVANPREKLQKSLEAKVKPRCEELGVEIVSVKVERMDPPTDLAAQIAQRDLARVEMQNNQSKVGQYKSDQQVKATEAKSGQAKQVVDVKTKLVREKTRAEARKKVQELQLKQELESAQFRLDAARKEAEAALTNGKADADVIDAQNEAEVAGLRTAVEGLGSAESYAQFQILSRVAPVLREIFASDESEFAKLFSAYLAPPSTPATKRSGPVAEMPHAR
jgi:hypothetical protein